LRFSPEALVEREAIASPPTLRLRLSKEFCPHRISFRRCPSKDALRLATVGKVFREVPAGNQ
jgi:hypothetical protein